MSQSLSDHFFGVGQTVFVQTGDIADGAVTAAKLASLSVDTADIANLAVTTGKIADDAVTSAKLDPTTIQYVAAPVSSANILAMNGAPVALIAAPGANKAIVVHDLVFEMKRSATAYANGGAVSIEYASGSDVIATIAATVVTGAAGTTLSSRVMANLSDVALADIENDAINITNATAAFITGTGTAEVHIWYSIIDVTA